MNANDNDYDDPKFDTIYRSESRAREVAERYGIDTSGMNHCGVCDAIEEYEEENSY